MKIIDILVNIANRKEVPKKIKYDDAIYVYSPIDKGYYQIGHGEDERYALLENLFNYIQTDVILNSEVKIIEEEKAIKEVELYQEKGDTLIGRNMWSFYYKINELVREVNRIKKRK